MTTKQSPLSALKRQANHIAAMLKAAERGEKIDVQFAEKIREARGRRTFKFAVVMDDKILTIEMPWTQIKGTSETGLSEYIVGQMRESRDTVQ
ncbi:hypothetical protein [Roseibium sp. Sym1]|uniref:hypothetical protein n=1 Tax=Roseibium sp. Sym1 TaxID=3016006 RepID=UPI0022B39448|nr:hypothetical protein [Roseibium sp. Sym1]